MIPRDFIKGRDLFDLALALSEPKVSPNRVVEAFLRYTDQEGERVSRAMLEKNLAEKRNDRVFATDMGPLLAEGNAWNFEDAFDRVTQNLVVQVPGEPWKGASG